MAMPKISEARKLTLEELNSEVISIKRQLFELRFKKATRQSIKPHLFKHLKHRLRQLLTVQTERERNK